MPRIALIVALILPVPAAAAEPDARRIEFFESKIRPILVEHCYKCHTAETRRGIGGMKKGPSGGLLLDSREGLLKGGDSGPAIVPGKPTDGYLLKALKYEGEYTMPPKGKLPDAVIADFEKWIKDGAIDPRDGNKIKAASSIDIEKGKRFWSFVPPKEPAVPTIQSSQFKDQNEIDSFIATEWRKRGLAPVGRADKRTLIRRVTLDLIGLPPSPEEVEAFVRDESPDAYAKVVERLLASSHHGEKWARHWLDVARYSEDQAHTFAVKPKTQAWRYRDWVIAAFNADMPYDRFVKLQIAGDLMADAPGDAFAKYAGLGFNGLGAEYYRDAGCVQRADADELDDRVDTLARGLLGLTVACARCHDHKYDPIPTRDYYSLAGIYAGTKLSEAPLCAPEEMKAYTDGQNRVKDAEGRLKKARAAVKASPEDRSLPEKVKELTEEVARFKKTAPPQPAIAHVISGNGAGMKVYIRGNPATKGEDAPKGFLQVLPSAAPPGKDFSRLDLANAIASKDNPLTARVIVNRVWSWHFGRGLVGTPSNFGALGERPSHPELLDWLSVNFVKNGWSLKWLHRQIVRSAVYQLSSNAEFRMRNAEWKKSVFGLVIPQSEFRIPNSEDPANVFLWRGNRRRLEVEQWRDSLLAVSGNLDRTRGGPTFDLKDPKAKRRTVYAKISRHELDGLLRLFDFPDANVTADKRTVTTVPQQQLFALNSEFMAIQARAFAARVQKLGTSDTERVTAAYRLAFGRAPTEREQDLAERFLALPPKSTDKLSRWEQYAQMLLASSEMMYVD